MTQHVLSIITPMHAPSLPYLKACYSSVLAQELPTDWTWEWLIQGDGVTADQIEAAGIAPSDQVRIGTNRPGGPGVARTMALARSHGELICNLDGDDLLLPGALARDIAALSQPDIAWSTCKALDLAPDGTLSGWQFPDPVHGAIPRGFVSEYWQANNWRLPVLPGTLCIRRDLAVLLGGWMALESSEDTGLLLAASETADGFFIDEPGLAYRKHDAQMTGMTHHVDPAAAGARRALILERANLVRAGGSRPV